MSAGNIRVFSGLANKQLAERVARRLGLELEKCAVQKFANQETRLEW